MPTFLDPHPYDEPGDVDLKTFNYDAPVLCLCGQTGCEVTEVENLARVTAGSLLEAIEESFGEERADPLIVIAFAIIAGLGQNLAESGGPRAQAIFDRVKFLFRRHGEFDLVKEKDEEQAANAGFPAPRGSA